MCAHPDDESFGLGAVLAALAATGTSSSVLCFTHGEASTLGLDTGDLHRVRAGELAAAAAALGVADAGLLDYPDGRLARIPVSQLAGHVREQARLTGPDALLVFDEGGITGHPDHCQATAAALSAAGRENLAVIAWTIPLPVAKVLNVELGTTFVGRSPEQVDLTIAVDRAAQFEAIACHASQSAHNRVLWRRLELMGNTEHLRFLRRTGARPALQRPPSQHRKPGLLRSPP